MPLPLLYALAQNGVKIEGITTVGGNCSVEQATKNACYLLELAGEGDIPVLRGGEARLDPKIKNKLNFGKFNCYFLV